MLSLAENVGEEAMNYYAHLGRFVELFAWAEAELHETLYDLSRLDPLSAIALLSGSKVDGDIGLIRRLYEARGKPMPSGLDRCLTQLAVINGFRNVLLHNQVENWTAFRKDGSYVTRRVVTNEARAFRAPSIQSFELTTEQLDAAANDLSLIIGYFSMLIGFKSTPWRKRQAHLRKIEQKPWLYKPPAPTDGHRCAIPTCRYIEVDIHHIIPWAQCQAHEYDNLIALCPNCHRRADAGEIDRKALRLYKANLRFTHDRFSQLEVDVLFELAQAPPTNGIPWPPMMNILVRRVVEAGLLQIHAPQSSVFMNGVKQSHDFLLITPKGRQYVADLGLHEL